MISDNISNEFLSKHSMFGGLDNSQLDILRVFLEQKEFQEDSYILRQDNPNNTVYFIVSGKVAVTKYHNKTKKDERTIVVLKKGDSFGEMELIDIQNCAANIICLTKVQTISLSNANLYKLSLLDFKIYTLIISNLARDISRRLRSTDNLLAMLS